MIVSRDFFQTPCRKLLSRRNGTKEKGFPSISLLRYKLGVVFQGRSMYMQQQTGAFREDRVFLMELKECSKRIYEIPQFLFYALGYAIEHVLSMSRKGINGFLSKKVKSQQLNLF